MTDIVERLRDQGKDAFAKQYSLGMFKLCDEAAVEIERLRAALAKNEERSKALVKALDESLAYFDNLAREHSPGEAAMLDKMAAVLSSSVGSAPHRGRVTHE